MKKLLLLILLIYQLGTVSGQYTEAYIDSLKGLITLDTLDATRKYFYYQRIISHYNYGPYDSMIKYTNQVVEHTVKIGEPKFLYAGSFLKARAFGTMGHFDSAKAWFNKAYDYASKDGNQARMSHVNEELAYLLMQQDSLLIALSKLKEAEAIYEELESKQGLRTTHNLMGYLMIRMQRYADAIAYRMKCLEESESRLDSANAYHNLYGPYALLKKYDSAKWALENGLALTPPGTGKYYSQLLNYSHLYLEPEFSEFDPKLVKICLDTIATTFLSKYAKRSDSLTFYLNRAGAEVLSGSAELAKSYIDLYEQVQSRSATKIDLYKLYWIKSEYYRVKGDFQQAYEHYFTYDTMKENYTNESVNNKLYMLSRSYELEKRDSKIQTLAFEKEKQELEASLFQKQRNGFIVVAVILILGGLVITRQSMLRKRTNLLLNTRSQQLETALGEKETLLKEIHHRVKNNLQVVSSLLNLQANDLTDVAAEAIKEGQLRVKSMALIHQKLYQDNDLKGIEVQSYLENLLSELLISFGKNNSEIAYQINANQIKLDVDTLVPLGLIVNELITNSLKYAFDKSKDGLLNIELSQEKEHLKVLVSDNGKGMDSSKTGDTSFGWKLIKSLCRQLKAEMEINTDTGTQVTLTISRYNLIV